MIRDWVNWLAPDLVGRDPRDPSIALHPNGRTRGHDAAVAGIDCALWDLRGKIVGQPYLENQAYDIVQQDASVCGITEAMCIAEVAHLYGVDTCPHTWLNGLAVTANAHCVAALPDPRVQELCMIQGPLQWTILADKPAIEDGYLVLPDKPGLSVTLAEDLEARFPHIEGDHAIRVER